MRKEWRGRGSSEKEKREWDVRREGEEVESVATCYLGRRIQVQGVTGGSHTSKISSGGVRSLSLSEGLTRGWGWGFGVARY